MKKYTIEYDAEFIKDSSYIAIKVIEPIETNEGIGDQIGIYKEDNILEFDECIDIDNEEIREFIKDYFKDYKSVMGFIRRITQ